MWLPNPLKTMENENENLDSTSEETTVETEHAEGEELDATALAEKNKELANANRQLFERAKKAEGFVKLDGKWVKAPKEEPTPEEKVVPQSKTGELDDNALDYLDLKGVSETEDIKIIEDIVKKTGMTVRQALKDEYVTAKLTANKNAREVANATPSGVKRGSGTSAVDVDSALAKFEQTGELPTDYELRSAVVNKMEAKGDSSRPPWKR